MSTGHNVSIDANNSAPIDFGDDDEQMHEDNGTIEDRYLKNVFITNEEAFNVKSLQKSKMFTTLYCIRPKDSVEVQGASYLKRGYIKCKGHKTYSCPCSVEVKLIQNYNPGGASYVGANKGSTVNDDVQVLKPMWYISSSTSNILHHCKSCH